MNRPGKLWIAVWTIGAVLAMRCGDADDVTGPSPHEPPASFAGTWNGTFVPGFDDCDGPMPAQARLEQRGAAVNGTLDASARFCGFVGIQLEGTLEGTRLTGTISGYPFAAGSTASGRLENGTLHITLRNALGPPDATPFGSMSLSR